MMKCLTNVWKLNTITYYMPGAWHAWVSWVAWLWSESRCWKRRLLSNHWSFRDLGTKVHSSEDQWRHWKLASHTCLFWLCTETRVNPTPLVTARFFGHIFLSPWANPDKWAASDLLLLVQQVISCSWSQNRAGGHLLVLFPPKNKT